MKPLFLTLISLLCLGLSFSCTPPQKFPLANEAQLSRESSDTLDNFAHFRWGISPLDVKLSIDSINKYEIGKTMTIKVKSFFCGNNNVEVELTFKNDKLVLFNASPYIGTDLNEAARVINDTFEFMHQFDPNFPLAFPRLTSENIKSQRKIVDQKKHRILALIIPIKKMPKHICLSAFINYDFEDSKKFRVDFGLMPA